MNNAKLLDILDRLDIKEGSNREELRAELQKIEPSNEKTSVELFLDLAIAPRELFNKILAYIIELRTSISHKIYSKLTAELILNIDDATLARLAKEYIKYYPAEIAKLYNEGLIIRLSKEAKVGNGEGIKALIEAILRVDEPLAYNALENVYSNTTNKKLINELCYSFFSYAIRVNSLSVMEIAMQYLYKEAVGSKALYSLNNIIEKGLNEECSTTIKSFLYYLNIAINGIKSKEDKRAIELIEPKSYKLFNILLVKLKYREKKILYYIEHNRLGDATAECKQLRSDIFCNHEPVIEGAGEALNARLKSILGEMRNGYYHSFFDDIENKKYSVSFDINKIGTLFPKNIVYLKYDKYECEFEVFDIFPKEEIVVLEINLPILYGTDTLIFRIKGDKLVYLKAYDEFDGYDPEDDEDLDINAFNFNTVTGEEE